jgi:regulator of RNase E activity RraB
MTRKPLQVVYDHWDTYAVQTDDGPLFVSFDVEAAQEDLTGTLAHCARVLVPIQRPNDNGGPVSPESERLYDMEDQLTAALVAHRVESRLVGRLTHAGVRELVFQLDDWDAFRPPVGLWMEDHPGYDIDVSEHEGWDFFNDCVRPTPEIWLELADRRVIQNLIESGSNPARKHALEFFFKGPEGGLRKLARKLEDQGYTPRGPSDFASGELAMVLRMKLDEGAICEESLANRNLADKFGVEYTGWGAAVVK